MSDDPVLDQLLALQASLERDAEADGGGLKNTRKSDLKSRTDRAAFIEIYGSDAYFNLPD